MSNKKNNNKAPIRKDERCKIATNYEDEKRYYSEKATAAYRMMQVAESNEDFFYWRSRYHYYVGLSK